MAVTLSSSTVTQLILVDASSGAVTVDLATTGTRCPDVLHVVKKIDSSTYAVTIQDSGGSQIEGSSTLALTNPNDSVVLALDSTANSWRVISKATTGLGGGGLSNGYIPYVSSGLLANSPIYVSGSYIGIGTTTPQYPLHIVGGTYDGSTPTGAGLGSTSILVEHGIAFKSAGTYNAGALILGMRGSLNSRDIGFFTDTDGGGGMYERMTIKANSGNVLIGTTSDNNNKLQVNGSAWINGALTVTGQVASPTLSLQPSSAPTGSNGIIYYDSTSNVFKAYQNGAWVNLISTAGVTGSGTANNLTKWTGSGTVGNSLIYDNGTNVGVNTISPSSTLTINGSFAAPVKTIASTSSSALTYNASSTDFTILCDATNNIIHVNLPDATKCQGRIYIVKKIDASSNRVEVIPAVNTQYVDGGGGVYLNYRNELTGFQSDGSNWYVVTYTTL